MAAAALLPCACCGYYTLGANALICGVCYWWKDAEAEANPDTIGKFNAISLNTARINYAEFGACEFRYTEYVRDPLTRELPEANTP